MEAGGSLSSWRRVWSADAEDADWSSVRVLHRPLAAQGRLSSVMGRGPLYLSLTHSPFHGSSSPACNVFLRSLQLSPSPCLRQYDPLILSSTAKPQLHKIPSNSKHPMQTRLLIRPFPSPYHIQALAHTALWMRRYSAFGILKRKIRPLREALCCWQSHHGRNSLPLATSISRTIRCASASARPQCCFTACWTMTRPSPCRC
jgi:hypothetical protein